MAQHFTSSSNAIAVNGLTVNVLAKTEEEIQPDNVYQMHGNQISVKTLDLNLEFAKLQNS